MAIYDGVRAGDLSRFLGAEAAERRGRVCGPAHSGAAVGCAAASAGDLASGDQVASLAASVIKLTVAVQALVAINGAMMRNLGTEMDRASVRDDALGKFGTGPDGAEAVAMVRALTGDPSSPVAVALN